MNNIKISDVNYEAVNMKFGCVLYINYKQNGCSIVWNFYLSGLSAGIFNNSPLLTVLGYLESISENNSSVSHFINHITFKPLKKLAYDISTANHIEFHHEVLP